MARVVARAEGRRGASVTVDLLSSAFDAFLFVFRPGISAPDPLGGPLLQDDDGAGGCNSRISFVFPEDSIYRVIVTTVEARKGGLFILRVTETPGPRTPGSCWNPSPKRSVGFNIELL